MSWNPMDSHETFRELTSFLKDVVDEEYWSDPQWVANFVVNTVKDRCAEMKQEQEDFEDTSVWQCKCGCYNQNCSWHCENCGVYR